MKTFYTFYPASNCSPIIFLYRSTFSIVVFTLLYGLSITNLTAQPTIEWDKTIGGNNREELGYIQQTSDGGYILGGDSDSDANGDKSEKSKGINDYWVVKLNAAGVKEWDKTMGGNGGDELTSLQQTADGGYILGGNSFSDVSGDKSENRIGNEDYWVIKLNAAGNKEWDKTVGGESSDFLYAIHQTADGGYILGGWSDSNASGDKSENAIGQADYWVVKLDAAGNLEWENTLGGKQTGEDNGSDFFSSIQQTADGGYIVGGHSNSAAGEDKSEHSKGGTDIWLVKLNAAGAKEWDKIFGTDSDDGLHAMQQTADGGYILGAGTFADANGDKSENSKGAYDYWIVKLNAAGAKEWDKSIGGSSSELLTAIQQTSEGGYILGGWSTSNASGDKSENVKGGVFDYWVVKLNASGGKEWDKTIGGINEDELVSMQQTADSGYIIGGTSDSDASGDKMENSRGDKDYWIVKLMGVSTPPTACTLALTTKVTQAEPWYGMRGFANGAGAIDLSVTSGTAPYIYQWNAGPTTEDITFATPGGFYSVLVTDANGCTGSTTVYVGRKNDFLRVLSSHSNVSTPGGNDGAIDLNVIGGVVPATYQWSNGATTEDLTGIPAGTYTVVVTDAFGRQTTTTVIISEPGTPLSLSIAHQNVSAPGRNDGTVDLTIVGGIGHYTYLWNTGATTEDLHYALPGHYSVTVTDANGTTATASVRVEVGPTPIMMDLKPITSDDVLASAAGLTAYPNPATERTIITFSLPAKGPYKLDLYDLRGAKVKEIAAGHAQANKVVQQDITLPKSACGVYLLKLLTDQGVASQRLLIHR